jgi:predicted acyltransferase
VPPNRAKADAHAWDKKVPRAGKPTEEENPQESSRDACETAAMENALSSPALDTQNAPLEEHDTPSRRLTRDAGRLVSLDALRGFIMLWIIGGEGLMVGLAALGHNRIIDTIVYQLNHTPWKGLRFYDCIWPCFMLMVGVSVPLSFAKRSLTQTYKQQLVHAAKRAVVLFLLGSLRESVSLGSPYLIELSSALQPIAIAYFIAFLVVRKSWQFQALLGAAILAVYGFILAFTPAPGIPAGSYEFNHNLVNWVDIRVLGQTHWDSWPYAKEGWGTLLSTIPTISTTLLGLLLGELLLSTRSKQSKAKLIAGIGLGCLAVGYGTSLVVPVVMKMWTVSYGLISAGWACLMLLIFYWLIDISGYRKWAFLLTVIGVNAIFIYMFSSLIHLGPIVEVFTRDIARVLPNSELLFQQLGILVVEWGILFWMYRRKIFLKV